MGESNVVRVDVLPTTPNEGDEQVEWYFNAIAGNGEIVSTSETYTRKDDAASAARDVFPDTEVRVFTGETEGGE